MNASLVPYQRSPGLAEDAPEAAQWWYRVPHRAIGAQGRL